MNTTPRRRFTIKLAGSTLLATALGLFSQGAFADDDFPSRPLKLVVPYAAGGATDILGRLLATALSEKLKQPVIVENKPGAGTAVAASAVAKSPADGYTLLLGTNATLTLGPAIRKNLSYDPVKSFTPIGLVAEMNLVFVTSNSVPGTTLKEIITQVKAAPDKFSYGSFGAGSSSHFGGEMLNNEAGLKMTHIPFNGSASSLTALMGGQIPVAVDTVVAAMPHIKANKIKVIAVLGGRRDPAFPQVPTVAESGYPGFEVGSWFAVLAPAGLPPTVLRKLDEALADIGTAPTMKQKMMDLGLSQTYKNSAQTTAKIEAELPKMRAIAARAGVSEE